ncbi:MAG: hypothetical protein IT366_24585 [Candidatus Hydrogenedentes bacterium]|nr:hypothetical protein [Candidatus Hydrogenedentota bacterium]
MITDPEVVKFVNEQLHPIAERIRADKVQLKAAFVAWQLKIVDKVPADDKEILEDGRDKEGVTRLSGADLHAFINVLTKYNIVGDEIGIDDIVEKLCVRPLEVR